MCPLGSVVEHSLHTRGVSSSNLLAGTNISNNNGRPNCFWVALFFPHTPKVRIDPRDRLRPDRINKQSHRFWLSLNSANQCPPPFLPACSELAPTEADRMIS